MPPPAHLTPAQIALQAERKAAKLAKKAAAAAANGGKPNAQQLAELERRRILLRSWVGVGGEAKGQRRARVVTWNMLAQTLVRRELFPGSDCLRWSDRKPMLQAEMASHADVDVICLQECDRLEDVLSSVPGHIPVTARGVGKLHGLVVLYKSARFHVRAQRALALDDEWLSPEAAGEVARRGVSRQTRNMGLVVALKENESDAGLIVVTTHLFWHPKFEYERTRQVIVLLRAVRRLQQEEGLSDWPVVFAGDLNTQPAETTYQLLAAPTAPVDPELLLNFNASRIVHTSVIKVGVPPNSEPPSTSASRTATPTPAAAEKDDEGEGEGELPDTDERSIANTRHTTPADGILTLEQLTAAVQEVLPSPARSAYACAKWEGETYGARGGFAKGVDGAGRAEPAYTCFTPLFKLTLDYLFVLPGSAEVEFTHLLAPAKTQDLGNGLPMKGISASDHLAVGCEIAW